MFVRHYPHLAASEAARALARTTLPTLRGLGGSAGSCSHNTTQPCPQCQVEGKKKKSALAKEAALVAAVVAAAEVADGAGSLDAPSAAAPIAAVASGALG